MSNPENLLAGLRSYSAYHTLILCDNISTANMLYTKPDVFINNDDDSDEMADIQIISNTESGQTGQYIVLVDGARKANYSIKEVSWSTTFAPTDDSKKSYNTIETEGQMTVVEPYGIEFTEELVNGTNAMGVIPSSTVFMLKTTFVGYDHDGEQKIINDVLPFTFTMSNLTSDMKESGSVHTLSFFGTSNGISKLPQISSIPSGLLFTLSSKDTLRTAMDKLEIAIDRKYAVYKGKLLEALATELGSSTGINPSKLLSERYLDVKYTIVLDPAYENARYKIGDNEPDNIFDVDGTFAFKADNTATVESTLNDIIKLSNEVNREATEDPDSHTSYMPMISTRLVPPRKENTYEIEYYISRYEKKHQSLTDEYVPVEGEYIEFDYFYTGKNTDILDMNIRMDMGLSFFQTQLAPSAYATSQSGTEVNSNPASPMTSVNGSTVNVDSSTNTGKHTQAKKAPLYLGMTVNPASFNHKKNALLPISFDQALARQAALESMECHVSIVGNPQLLNESLATSPNDTNVAPVTGNVIRMYNTPALVKINIKYPSNKELTGVKDFWYQGFYTIYAIEHTFKDGTFTQDLKLFNLPVSSGIPRDLATQDLSSPSVSVENPKVHYDVQPATEKTSAGSTSRSVQTATLPASGLPNDPNTKLWFKQGVVHANLDEKITNLYDDIVDVWKLHTDVAPVVTSGSDSKHSPNSLHYKNLAIDLRVNNLDSDIPTSIEIGRKIARDLAVRVGNDYDVIYESSSSYFNNHIHLEYDPKPVYSADGD